MHFLEEAQNENQDDGECHEECTDYQDEENEYGEDTEEDYNNLKHRLSELLENKQSSAKKQKTQGWLIAFGGILLSRTVVSSFFRKIYIFNVGTDVLIQDKLIQNKVKALLKITNLFLTLITDLERFWSVLTFLILFNLSGNLSGVLVVYMVGIWSSITFTFTFTWVLGRLWVLGVWFNTQIPIAKNSKF